ncbi:MAG TPA: molybdopterin converting factor subunit 1 [Candidatus Krumholzibacteria bacterium]|nr:molybdopterin converting factor subunit 1 [Candidatus Krumholzibacteria bacterium]
MHIEVLFFAAARDAARKPSASLTLPAGTTAGSALGLLLEQEPALRGLQASLRLAVNEEFVDSARVLREGDCLALIPPVSGG